MDFPNPSPFGEVGIFLESRLNLSFWSRPHYQRDYSGRDSPGRSIYAIGINETASRFAGLRVGSIKKLAYTLSGLMAGVAGFILTSRVTSTRADAAQGFELEVIAAVVFGGTSIIGGRGTILGTVLGVVTIQLLKNGLQLSGVRGEGTIILIGSVLIISILLNQFLEKTALRGRRLAQSNPPSNKGGYPPTMKNNETCKSVQRNSPFGTRIRHRCVRR